MAARDGARTTYTVTVTRLAANAPAAPTNLKATSGDRKLDLSWTAPSGTVTGYDVHYTSAQSTTVPDGAAVLTGAAATAAKGWVEENRSGTTATEEITGLSDGTTYRVRLRAETAAGKGFWAHATGTTAGAADPPAPTGTTVWSATLTVKDILSNLGVDFGCDNLGGASVRCSSTNVLTEDQLTHNGVTYDIKTIRLSGEKLAIILNKNAPSSFDSFTLEVGSSSIGSLDSASGG